MDEIKIETEEDEEEFCKRMEEYDKWLKEDREAYDKKFKEGQMLAERLERFYINSQKNKRKRNFCTFSFFVIKNIIVFSIIVEVAFEWNIDTIISVLIFSAITGGIAYWVNLNIFTELFVKSEEDKEVIESMKKELQKISKELNLKPRYETEDAIRYRHM